MGMRVWGGGFLIAVVLMFSGVALAAGGDGTTIEDRKTAADGVTQGWLIASPWPDDDPSQQWRTIRFTLVIARHGHVVRRVSHVQSFWGWNFREGGRQVAYEDGPLHGATECVLMDVRSGRRLAVFGQARDCRNKPEDAPAWVKSLQEGALVLQTRTF